MAKADQEDAYKQLPERRGRQFLAVVPLKDPAPGSTRGSDPKTQLSGAAAAALNYDAVSRVI